MQQSPELSEFYEVYAGWLLTGAPHNEPFKQDEGLCWNLSFFALHSEYDAVKLSDELRTQLRATFAFPTYPFNSNGAAYADERESKSCHLNAARIKWVEDHAQ